MGLDLAELLIARLRAEGRRITMATRALVDALVAANGHVTAEELIVRLQAVHPDMASSTVYRHLVDLEQLGLVVHVHLGHGPAVYHLAGAAHVHLVCDRCGALAEVPSDMVDAMADQLRSAFGFEAGFHHFSIGGNCQDCATAQSPPVAKHGQSRARTRTVGASPALRGG